MVDRYRIRSATSADLPRMVALERMVFPDPWSQAMLRESLGSLSLVIDAPGRGVVAYLLARFLGEEGEILNLAVHPDERGRGLGGALVEEAMTRLAAGGARAVFLEVRASNQAALRLYRRLGFERVGRRPKYYRRPREDALILARKMGVEPGPA